MTPSIALTGVVLEMKCCPPGQIGVSNHVMVVETLQPIPICLSGQAEKAHLLPPSHSTQSLSVAHTLSMIMSFRSLVCDGVTQKLSIYVRVEFSSLDPALTPHTRLTTIESQVLFPPHH